jgi:hypothetical protein
MEVARTETACSPNSEFAATKSVKEGSSKRTLFDRPAKATEFLQRAKAAPDLQHSLRKSKRQPEQIPFDAEQTRATERDELIDLPNEQQLQAI